MEGLVPSPPPKASRIVSADIGEMENWTAHLLTNSSGIFNTEGMNSMEDNENDFAVPIDSTYDVMTSTEDEMSGLEKVISPGLDSQQHGLQASLDVVSFLNARPGLDKKLQQEPTELDCDWMNSFLDEESFSKFLETGVAAVSPHQKLDNDENDDDDDSRRPTPTIDSSSLISIDASFVTMDELLRFELCAQKEEAHSTSSNSSTTTTSNNSSSNSNNNSNSTTTENTSSSTSSTSTTTTTTTSSSSSSALKKNRGRPKLPPIEKKATPTPTPIITQTPTINNFSKPQPQPLETLESLRLPSSTPSPAPLPKKFSDEKELEKYLKYRRHNNEAACKSRQKRKEKEKQNEDLVKMLTDQNSQLRDQLQELKDQHTQMMSLILQHLPQFAPKKTE